MGNKNSRGGPRATLSQAALGQLETEVSDYNPIDQPGLDGVVRNWFRLYHSLVWLSASVDGPQGISRSRREG